MRRADKLAAFMCRLSGNVGSPKRPITWTVLPLPLPFIYIYIRPRVLTVEIHKNIILTSEKIVFFQQFIVKNISFVYSSSSSSGSSSSSSSKKNSIAKGFTCAIHVTYSGKKEIFVGGKLFYG